MERDELISERPARITFEAIRQGLADEYSQPRKPRLTGGHGQSVELPAVSGGSGDPPPPPTANGSEPEYNDGLMTPVEYILAEGGLANGAAITHHTIGRDPDRAALLGLVVPAWPPMAVSIVDGMAVERVQDTAPLPDIESHVIEHESHAIARNQPANETVYPTWRDTLENLVVFAAAFWCLLISLLVVVIAFGGM